MRYIKKVALAGLLSAAMASSAWADTYPTKPIQLIVPFGAGGVTDTVSRLLAKGLSAQLGQPIVVENKPGASGMIGASFAARAPADGYTLLVGNISTLAINPLVLANMTYDPVKDFESVSMLSTQPIVLVTSIKQKVSTVKELADLAKNKPGGLDFGSGGASYELMNASFMKDTGIPMTTVRFKGDAGTLGAILSDTIDVTLSSTSSAHAMVQSGKVHALGLTALERTPLLPDVPTLAELGVPLEASSWQAISVQAGTPAEIINKLNAAMKIVLEEPEFKKQFQQLGVTASYTTPEGMQQFVEGEQKRWAAVAKEAGVKAQ